MYTQYYMCTINRTILHVCGVQYCNTHMTQIYILCIFYILLQKKDSLYYIYILFLADPKTKAELFDEPYLTCIICI
jgi:hypothetical protein